MTSLKPLKKLHPDFLNKLEPEVKSRGDALVLHEGETVVLVSIAISAKRIADALDHICNYGIVRDVP